MSKRITRDLVMVGRHDEESHAALGECASGSAERVDLGSLHVAHKQVDPFESVLAHQPIDAYLPVLVPTAVALPDDRCGRVVIPPDCSLQDGARLNIIEFQVLAPNL